MKNTDIIISGVIIDEASVFSISEICQQYEIGESLIIEMLEYGLIEPTKTAATGVLLNGKALRRIQSALRLQHDLGINLQGAVLAVELMDELAAMRSELAILRNHLTGR
jgi:chaperone modulatory protein CbpM